MILLSLRRNFDSRLLFGSKPEWRIPVGETTTGRRCLFMIHGYENSVGAAEGNFANIERNLTDCGLLGPTRRFNQLVGVLWPGQTALGFWIAEAAADQAAELLRGEINTLKPETVSFVTHSLGARVAMKCVAGLNAETIWQWPLREMVLLAPAVNDNCLDRGGDYFGSAFAARLRTLVCYSRRDEVLGVWFRRFSAFLNFNDVALGYNGPRDLSKCGPLVSTFDGTPFVGSHGGWMSCKEMYAMWSAQVWG